MRNISLSILAIAFMLAGIELAGELSYWAFKSLNLITLAFIKFICGAGTIFLGSLIYAIIMEVKKHVRTKKKD